ncbi:hypothetical protein [Nitrospira defluvii]|uniref:NAD-dependent epimerase/dehydratase n=1 Tax=Nitrospira defluvii TaxID=330214 RepID=A0ABM8QCR7_9BACT|nr:hypothetical protein [Nitrospira defluvii]CAE6689350.1 conserved hypothetical protein [Nitrospira defluvii]
MQFGQETRTGRHRKRPQETGRRFEYDGAMTAMPPLAILGFGYTGRCIFRLARTPARRILASSRRPESHLTDIPPPDRLRFDLTDQSSWHALPCDADLIWTFPATPLDQVQAFARHHCHAGRKLVVLGSTSAYDRNDHPPVELPPWIDETSPVNGDLPRVQGEEYLRTHHGAVILRVAGIYGPHRNPVEWIRRGRVGPTNKFVNLIHVEDLAQLCLQALAYGQPGASYNISDGHPRRWTEICHEVSSRWGVVSPRQAYADESGKRILNHRALTQLRYRLRYPDFYQALRSIEDPPALAPAQDQHPAD